MTLKLNIFRVTSAFLFLLFFFNSLYKGNVNAIVLSFVFILAVITLPFLLKKIDKIILLMAFLSPLSFDFMISSGAKLSIPIEPLLILGSGLILLKIAMGLKLNRQLLLHPMSMLIGLFFICMFLTSLISTDSLVSFKRLISQSIYYVVFYLGTLQFISKNQIKKLYFLYGLGLVLPVINSLINHSKWGFVQEASVYVALPFYEEHTIFGACLAFVIPFFILVLFSKKTHFNTKVFAFFLTLLFTIALLLSYSRAAWISILLAGLFVIYTKFKFKFSVFIAFTLLISVLIGFNFDKISNQLSDNSIKYSNDFSSHIVSVTNLKNDASNLERVNRWVCAVRMFQEKPFAGFGPGTYQFNYGNFQTKEYTTRISTHLGDKGNAHSEYLAVLSEMGIFGFLIFIGIVLYSIYLSIKLLNKNIKVQDKLIVYASILGLMTFYTHGFFNAFSDSHKMAILIILSLTNLVRLNVYTSREEELDKIGKGHEE